MKNKFLALVIVFVCSLGLSIQAYAAEPIGYVEGMSGRTFIKHEGVIYSAIPNAAIYTGDEIVTVNGASAVLKFSNGCDLSLNENSLVRFTTNDQCSSPVRPVQLSPNSPYYNYTFARASSMIARSAGGVSTGSGFLIPAVLAAGGGLAAVVLAGKGSGITPTSP